MKKRIILWVLLGLLVLITAVSCKSKPATQEEAPPVVDTLTLTPAPTPAPPPDNSPDQASLDALNRAAARAAAARKLILDFEGPSFFPEDWQLAESLYTQAVEQRDTSTRQAVQDSTLRYDRATAGFESMTNKTFQAGYDFAVRGLNSVRERPLTPALWI